MKFHYLYVPKERGESPRCHFTSFYTQYFYGFFILLPNLLPHLNFLSNNWNGIPIGLLTNKESQSWEQAPTPSIEKWVNQLLPYLSTRRTTLVYPPLFLLEVESKSAEQNPKLIALTGQWATLLVREFLLGTALTEGVSLVWVLHRIRCN